MSGPGAAERILVCVGSAPSSERLVRAAERMAAALSVPWTAAYVEASVGAISDSERDRLESHLRLAESLGADVTRLSGSSVAGALLEHARQHGVTRIVLGKPTHARILDLLRGSLVDQLVRASGAIDVLVISGESSPERELRSAATEAVPFAPLRYLAAVLLIAATSAVAVLLRSELGIPDVEGLYFVTVMIAAVRLGRGPSVFTAMLAVAAYDFLLVPPVYTLHVTDPRYLLTFGLMFAVGVLVSELAARVRRQEREALLRQERSSALSALTRDLASAHDAASAAEVIVRHAAQVFQGSAAVLQPDASGELAEVAHMPMGTATSSERASGRATLRAALRVANRELGVLLVQVESERAQGAEQLEFFQTFSRQAAFALERARLAAEARAMTLRAETEQLRGSLLSAVSHDLRTPLASITGAASSLRHDPALPELAKVELLESICEEAERLDRLVTNLLDMTRIESGAVVLKREWIPLEEIVGSAFTRLEKELGDWPISVRLAQNLPLLLVDPLLFEQVLLNLLENAAKYTAPDATLDVAAELREGQLCLQISDSGPGLPGGAEERVFDKFYRGTHVGIRGIGLGLSICRWIVEAHGGKISAHNRPEGGALFRLTLPLAASQPALSSDLAEARS